MTAEWPFTLGDVVMELSYAYTEDAVREVLGQLMLTNPFGELASPTWILSP